MMKSLFLLCILLLTQPGLIKTKVADGITVSIPATLIPMTSDDIGQRFPSARAPLGAYTDQSRTVDFSVNISATQWPDANADMAKEFFKSSLMNLYDRVEIIGEGIHVLHKKKFIYFEFDSRISGDRRKQGLESPVLKYTYIQYYVAKNRTLVFTFSCPKDLKEEWQAVVGEMMKSVRVR